MTKKNIKIEATKKQGRPVNPNSERQARLASRAALQAQGVEIKRGRPVEETSARQARLALKGKVALGRKVDPTSERQKRLAAMELKRASGIEVKRGRPKMVKADDAAAE
jgi:hypothetical protein